MKVLFCSNEPFLPTTVGGSIENVKIVERLVERGHEVIVATPLFIDPKPIEEKYRVKLESFSPFKINKFMKFREAFYVLYAFLFVFHLMRLFRRYKFDAVFAQNCLVGLSALPVKYFSGAVFFLSMTDFLSGFLYHHPFVPAKVTDVLVRIEKLISLRYEHIFVITPRMKDELLNAGHKPEKIKVVYIGVDTAMFNPEKIGEESKFSLRKELNLKGKVVLFQGTIQRDALPLFRQIVEFKSYGEEITFLILGAGRGYDLLKREIKQENVIFKNAVLYQELPKYVAISDVGIIPYKKTFNSDIILTIKILEYLALGIPVVCSDLSGIRQIFGRYDFVKMVEKGEKFPEIIRNALLMSKSRDSVAFIRENFSWDKITGNIVKEMETDVGKK